LLLRLVSLASRFQPEEQETVGDSARTAETESDSREQTGAFGKCKQTALDLLHVTVGVLQCCPFRSDDNAEADAPVFDRCKLAGDEFEQEGADKKNRRSTSNHPRLAA